MQTDYPVVYHMLHLDNSQENNIHENHSSKPEKKGRIHLEDMANGIQALVYLFPE